jgi:hypothetical protein
VLTRSAVQEDAADAGVLQCKQVGIGMFRRGQVVGPVSDRGDSCVEGLQRPPQGTGIAVGGFVERRDPSDHRSGVPDQRDLSGAAAEGALPDMPVRVHQTRHDEPTGRFDDVRLRQIRSQARADSGDPAVSDEYVGRRQVAEVRVEGDHMAATDEQV